MYTGLEFVWGNLYRYLVNAGLLPIVPSSLVDVANIAALQALTTRPALVTTRGYTTPNDGGGGPVWQWVPSSTATIDNFMVVSPTGSPSGRYIRMLQSGGAVNPKWAGCGLGAADDSVQWQKVIDFGAPIDGADGTYPIDALLVGTTSTIPSIINCNFIPAPSATTASRLFRIDKTAGIRLRNITFVSPISASPTVQPIVDLALFFNTAATISDVWVENCRFVGGNDGMNFSGDFNSIFVQNCLFESTWRGGSTLTSPHYVSYIGCQFIGCGVSDGTGAGASLSAALRLGSSTQAVTPELFEVIGCTFKDCCVNAAQEALDLSGNAAKNVVIANNNCSGCGNGFVEAKCQATGATSGDNVYRRWEFSGNNVELLTTGGVGFNLHTSNNTTTTAGKLAQVLISGNRVGMDAMPASSTAPAACIVNGWNDVSITGNQFINLGRGIELDGYGVDTDIVTRITINANTLYVFANCIFTSTTGGLTSTIDDLVVTGNHLRAVQIVSSFGATAPSLVTQLTFTGNIVQSDTTNGLDIRNVTLVDIFDNFFDVDDVCVICQGTTPVTVNIKRNFLRSATTNALTLTTGTAVTVTGNEVSVPVGSRTWTGAATVFPADNVRGTATADPSPTFAGAIGDVVLNSAPAAFAPKQWVCTTAGNAAAAVYSAQSQLGGLQRVAPVVLGGNVALNNVANYFNGPNTGSIGAAGQVWAVWANFTVSQTGVGPDYYLINIYDGTAIQGGEQTIASVGIGVNVAGSCFAIVTLAGATTFTARAKDVSSTGGSLLATGTSIEAVRLA